MNNFKRLKRLELDIYDLIKRYQKSGTKEELVEELKELDKNIMKGMSKKPAVVKEIEKTLKAADDKFKKKRKEGISGDFLNWYGGYTDGLERALEILEEDK